MFYSLSTDGFTVHILNLNNVTYVELGPEAKNEDDVTRSVMVHFRDDEPLCVMTTQTHAARFVRDLQALAPKLP